MSRGKGGPTVLPRDRWRRTSATKMRKGSEVSRQGKPRRFARPPHAESGAGCVCRRARTHGGRVRTASTQLRFTPVSSPRRHALEPLARGILMVLGAVINVIMAIWALSGLVFFAYWVVASVVELFR